MKHYRDIQSWETSPVVDSVLAEHIDAGVVSDAHDRLRGRLNVARAIVDARLARDWSQSDLAEVAGTTQARVSEIETLRTSARIDTIDKIANVLGLEITLLPRRAAAWMNSVVDWSLEPIAFSVRHQAAHSLVAAAQEIEPEEMGGAVNNLFALAA